MKRFLFGFLIIANPALFMSGGARGAFWHSQEDAGPTMAQIVYTETPVDSYDATVDDVNFIPESEFMRRTDSLNYDQNIDIARTADPFTRATVPPFVISH